MRWNYRMCTSLPEADLVVSVLNHGCQYLKMPFLLGYLCDYLGTLWGLKAYLLALSFQLTCVYTFSGNDWLRLTIYKWIYQSDSCAETRLGAQAQGARWLSRSSFNSDIFCRMFGFIFISWAVNFSIVYFSFSEIVDHKVLPLKKVEQFSNYDLIRSYHLLASEGRPNLN